ncbi:MAG: hypothetical protein QXI19_05635 [Candidatus Caldarchaeum sp.]
MMEETPKGTLIRLVEQGKTLQALQEALQQLRLFGRVELPNGEVYELSLEVEENEWGPYADLYRGRRGKGTEPQPVDVWPALRKVA